jgi:hypothetical protein
MKTQNTHDHHVEEAFSPTTVYTPRWMLPILKDALIHEAEADYVDLAAPPHKAHHISLHRHRGSSN